MDPLFDLDLAVAGLPDDGGLFPAGAAAPHLEEPALGRHGQLVWFWHPSHGETVVGTWFGPGPRADAIAVTFGGDLLLIDTTTWTITV